MPYISSPSRRLISIIINDGTTGQMSRNWIGTYNNPPDLSLCEAYLELWSKAPKCTYVTGQLEKGEQGTVHI